jgi:endonuclease/exonuclease/phosphatase family metal-dependent hydrolase
VWQEFAHRSSGTRLLVVGTHFSPWPNHDAARVRHARMLARRVRRINREAMPVVILGDFNSWTGRAPATPMSELAAAGFRDALPDTNGTRGTLMRRDDDRQFDHIAVSHGLAITRSGIETPKLAGPASDHRLVWADLDLER